MVSSLRGGCHFTLLDNIVASDTKFWWHKPNNKKIIFIFASKLPINYNPDSMNILFTNVNLDFYLKNPQIIGEHCYQLRVAISENPNNLVPKTFFANLLECDVIKLCQIESGHVYNTALAIRYLLKLNEVYNLFNPNPHDNRNCLSTSRT